MPIPKSTNGEMPFLDHLEELRWRIIYSAIALMIGVAIGLAIAFRYNIVAILAAPAMAYMGGAKLIVTQPVPIFTIRIQIAFLIGIGIAAPVIGYQLWRTQIRGCDHLGGGGDHLPLGRRHGNNHALCPALSALC